jgi:hypothetical protein
MAFPSEDGCIVDNCGSICRPCGDEICQDNENECNCPEDCEPPSEKNYTYTIPILVLKYFPVVNGKVNINITGDWRNPDLNVLRNSVENLMQNTIGKLENGSSYKMYKDPDATPSLNYFVYEEKEFLYPIPPSEQFKPFADHMKILSELDICNYVENEGVKQVWVYMYHTQDIAPIESNMAGPYGDISNSYRQSDLPVCNKTYVVIDYNYGRGISEALENHCHQFEAVFIYCTVYRNNNLHTPPNNRQ